VAATDALDLNQIVCRSIAEIMPPILKSEYVIHLQRRVAISITSNVFVEQETMQA
jgi:hypothetical protein